MQGIFISYHIGDADTLDQDCSGGSILPLRRALVWEEELDTSQSTYLIQQRSPSENQLIC